MKKTPHPCAPMVIAWANGEAIQWWSIDQQEWIDCDKLAPPDWNSNVTYRIKPEAPNKVYPESSLTLEELRKILNINRGLMSPVMAKIIANEAIKRYIQDIEEGDV